MKVKVFESFADAVEAYSKWLRGEGPQLFSRIPSVEAEFRPVDSTQCIASFGGVQYGVKEEPDSVRVYITEGGYTKHVRWRAGRNEPQLPPGCRWVGPWHSIDQ